MIIPTAALWAAAGDALSGLASSPRWRRPVVLALAALVAVMVALVWL